MSIDKSLVLKNQLTRSRNVLSRTERLKTLLEDGRWNEEDSVFGLPKVRTFAARKKGKKSEEKEAVEAAAAGEAGSSAEGTSAGGGKTAKSASKS